MNKYRIIKRGNTDNYVVQQEFRWIFWIFWINRMGAFIPISLKEAREYVKMFQDSDKYAQALKAPNTVVE